MNDIICLLLIFGAGKIPPLGQINGLSAATARDPAQADLESGVFPLPPPPHIRYKPCTPRELDFFTLICNDITSPDGGIGRHASFRY